MPRPLAELPEKLLEKVLTDDIDEDTESDADEDEPLVFRPAASGRAQGASPLQRTGQSTERSERVHASIGADATGSRQAPPGHRTEVTSNGASGSVAGGAARGAVVVQPPSPARIRPVCRPVRGGEAARPCGRSAWWEGAVRATQQGHRREGIRAGRRCEEDDETEGRPTVAWPPDVASNSGVGKKEKSYVAVGYQRVLIIPRSSV